MNNKTIEKIEQLERLTKLALLDGVVTEKEKQVLFKRAEELDIDVDEYEMMLEAWAAEVRKSLAAKRKAEEAKRKEEETSSGMILEYEAGTISRRRNEAYNGMRVFVPTNWRTDEDGYVSKHAIPEIRESLRDMGITLSFDKYNPFAVAGWDDVLLFWKKVK